MNYDPERHHRRSIRLKQHDYSTPGAYFVTVCTNERICVFGQVTNEEVQLNDFGVLAEKTWEGLPARFSAVSLDSFVIMPNHLHGIVIMRSTQNRRRNSGAINRAPTLGKVVRAYKAVSARMLRHAGCANFAWQRNYYEHIIRSDESLERIRRYILDNPTRWMIDRENPSVTDIEPEEAWRL
jgi:putative transposase